MCSNLQLIINRSSITRIPQKYSSVYIYQNTSQICTNTCCRRIPVRPIRFAIELRTYIIKHLIMLVRTIQMRNLFNIIPLADNAIQRKPLLPHQGFQHLENINSLLLNTKIQHIAIKSSRIKKTTIYILQNNIRKSLVMTMCQTIIFVSFMSRGVFGDVVYEFSLESYQTLLDSIYFKVIVKSLQVALFTTVACLLLGYPFAYYIARKPPAVASRLIMLIMIPFWTNSLMRLNSWLLLFQTSGPVNTFLQWAGITSEPVTFIYTDPLVMLGLVTNMLPFAVLPLYSTIEKLQNSLLEASSDLGANPRQTFFRITLPLTFPGIFSAVILVFIPSLGIYTVSDMLGGGKVLYIGNIIKNQFGSIRNWPLGAALSVLLLVITGALIFLYTRFSKLEDMEVV